MRRTFKKLRSLVLTAAIIPMVFATPAHAIFGFGDIVIDPTNLIQNALTATRTLQQVTDQARMLRNQVTQMTRLGIYVGEDFERTLSELNRLTHQARGLTYRIDEIERVFEMHFPDAYADWSQTEQAQIADAQQDAAIMAFRDSIQMQAQITQAIEQDGRQLNVLMNVTALSAKQTMQMQTLMAAQYRAEAIVRSRALYQEQVGAARHEAFMGRGG